MRIVQYVRRHHVGLVALFVAATGTAYAGTQVARDPGSPQTLEAEAAKKKKKKKRIRGPAGPPGPAGAPGAPGANGTNGTNGTSTGETFFASAGFGANFGGGGSCDAIPSGGPTIGFNAPAGSYVQVMASATVQRAGATSNTVCVRVDATDVVFSTSTSLAAETRHLQRGSTTGTTDPLAASPLTFAVSAGAHTVSLRYGSAGGTSNFSNRNLRVTLFHPST
jgi:hypothetical protein